MSPTEWVDVVDEHNVVLGRSLRSQVRSENLLHRGVAILVHNGHGQVYVHQRTATKDLFPALFDMFVGGVVASGESYEAAALREVSEELGVNVTSESIEYLFDHLYLGDKNRSWVRAFRVRWDGPVTHQPEEVQWGGWMSESDLPAWVEKVEIVPDGLEVFHRYLASQAQSA